MRRGLLMRVAATTGAGALIVAFTAGPAVAGGGAPPEAGLIAAADLAGNPLGTWREGPPQPGDTASLNLVAKEIDACAGVVKLTKTLEGADKVDGSNFLFSGETADGNTIQGEEIRSSVAVVGKKKAKRAVSLYASGAAASCFEELLSTVGGAGNDVTATGSKGPGVGDGSGILEASVSGEASFTFQLVLVRVGGTLATYGYETEIGVYNTDDFTAAVEAAGARLEAAA